jgi:hypothetical protein
VTLRLAIGAVIALLAMAALTGTSRSTADATGRPAQRVVRFEKAFAAQGISLRPSVGPDRVQREPWAGTGVTVLSSSADGLTIAFGPRTAVGEAFDKISRHNPSLHSTLIDRTLLLVLQTVPSRATQERASAALEHLGYGARLLMQSG